jgi:hypothetical protein
MLQLITHLINPLHAHGDRLNLLSRLRRRRSAEGSSCHSCSCGVDVAGDHGCNLLHAYDDRLILVRHIWRWILPCLLCWTLLRISETHFRLA